MQSRITSFSFLRGKNASAASVPSKEGTAPVPGPKESWKVDEAFLEQGSLLVPASPDDVDDTVRAAFLAKAFQGEEWVDIDFVQYSIGVALDIFPEKATFDSLKWIFWTDNSLQRKLSNLVQALARPESRCLESRTTPDFQFRRFSPTI